MIEYTKYQQPRNMYWRMYFKELENHQGHHTILGLKENYTPVQHPPWSVPVGMQSVYKAELDKTNARRHHNRSHLTYRMGDLYYTSD